MTLMKGIYIGPKELLKGKTAHLEKCKDGYCARFDDVSLVERIPSVLHPENKELTLIVQYGYFFHTFKKEDFELCQ